MKKGFAIAISLIITLLIFISFHNATDVYLEEVIVKRVIDGDTFVSYDSRTFRLANINSPEKGKARSELSASFLSNFVNKTVKVNSISLDNRGEREVARIYFDDNYINLQLVERGLAPKAWVEEDELSLFALAESEAVEKERGMWKKSEYFGCLNISLNKELEEINVKNKCNNFKIKGSMIKDESREYFIIEQELRDFTIRSGEAFSNKSKDFLYWTKENIWNNDRDTIYFFDKENDLVFYQAYGY